MRSAIVSLVSAVAFAACSSGTTYVTVRQPVPAPQPPEPLEIIIGRPVRDNMLVQTNRHAYVAIFEIIPERGVALVYPSSARQRRVVLSGLSRLPVWWTAQRATHGNGRPSLETQPARYIYAIASDEPLRLADDAFQPGYLHRMLGSGAYRAMNVHATMRALSRHFVTAVVAEEWAEDVYVLAPKYASEPYRIARVYCPEGTLYEVPIEMADRVWCPTQPRDAAEEANRPPGRDVATLRRKPMRPDSVLGDNGLRVRTRARGRGLLSRIPDSVAARNPKKTDVADEAKDSRGNGRGNGGVQPGHDPLTEAGQGEKSKGKSDGRRFEDKSEEKKSDARPENNSDIKWVGHDKSRSDADKGSPNDKKHEPHAESKPESKAETKEEPKTEEKREPKTETKGKVKEGSKAEAKEEPKADAKEEPKAETKPDPRSEKRSEPPKSRGRSPSA